VSGTKFDCPDAKNFTCEVYDVTQPQIKVCIPEVYKHPAPPPGPKTCKNWNEWALFSAGNHGGCKAECIQTSPSHLHSVHGEFVMGDWGCYCFVNSNLRVLHSKELKPFVTSLYLSPCAMVKEVYAKVPKCHL
jgi:hypothetical protein